MIVSTPVLTIGALGLTIQTFKYLNMSYWRPLGELGEAANILKKIIRGDKSLAESKQELSEEITDVFYLRTQIDISVGY